MRLVPTLFVVLLVVASVARGEILVGVAGPMGGQNAVFGTQMKAGADAAIAAANGAGGIKGEMLRAVIADDGCDTRKAFDVSRELAQQDVRVVIGHFCSGATLAAAKTYLEAGIVMITPAATLPAVTDQEGWNIIRLANRDDAQADIAAARIGQDVPQAKIAVVTDGSALFKPLAARVVQRAPTANTFTLKPDATNAEEVAAKIKADGATAIYFALSADDAGTMAKAVRAGGITAPFFGPDLLLNEIYAERAGSAADGTLVTFGTDPQMMGNPFKASSAFADPAQREGATLPAYAAVEAFVAAATATDVNNGRAMADWLRGGNSIETILGPVRFDAKGDLAQQRFTWYRWNEGQFAEDKPTN